METLEDPKKPNYKNFTDDKDYFSAYLNLARHNLFITLKHISEKIGEIPPEEDNLFDKGALKLLKDNTNPERSLKCLKLLMKHLPFIKPVLYYQIKNELPEFNSTKVDDIDWENSNPFNEMDICIKILDCIITNLVNYRNFYTHQGYEEPDSDKKLIKYLDTIFDCSVRLVKKRFPELNTVQNELSHLIRLDRKREISKHFKHSFISDNKITQEGIAFLISLFLEPSYSTNFLKKIKGFKDSRENKHKATLYTYQTMRLIIPQERIENEDTSLSLALDMFNELKRCPSELYDLLDKKDADTFKITDNEVQVDEESFAQETILKRKKNRFPYFSLSYMDYKMNSTIPAPAHIFRFMVDMGTYYHEFYNKNNIDGEERLRSLNKHILSYGDPVGLDKLKTEKWNKLIVTNPGKDYNEKYVSDTYPHYHISNNNIGIVFKNLPDELPALQKKGNSQKPHCWLSMNMLPEVIFYYYLKKESDPDATGKLIFDFRQNIIRLFKDISENKIELTLSESTESILKKNYSLNLSDLPEEIKNYLCGKQEQISFDQKAEEKLKSILKDTVSRIEKINELLAKYKSKDNKPGKKNFIEVKSGKLADYLAIDMIKMQPVSPIEGTKCQGKINDQDFQVLQARLAFYGRDRHMLTDIFKKARLVDSDNPHPFLKDMDPMQHYNIVDFYKAYLNKKKEFIERCLNEKKITSYTFLKPYFNKWIVENRDNYIRQKTERLSNMPVFLPSYLFLNAIKVYFSEINKGELKKLRDKITTSNSVYLVQKYLELEKKDSNQFFYTFRRGYPAVKNTDGNGKKSIYCNKDQLTEFYKNRNNKIKDFQKRIRNVANVNINEEIKKLNSQIKNMVSNEQNLRLSAMEDILIYLMAMDIFKSKDVHFEEGSLLKDISAHGKSILDTQIKIIIKTKYSKYIIQNDLKIKNYGDLLRFAKDRRLKNLLLWFDKSSFERKQVEDALRKYEDARLEICNIVHKFEKEVSSIYKKEILAEKGEKKYVSFENVINVYSKECRTDKNKTEMKKIRNAFFHNQFPVKVEISNNEMKNTKDLTILVEKMRDYAIEVFTEAIQTLNFIKQTQEI